jgi:hypothetical protein
MADHLAVALARGLAPVHHQIAGDESFAALPAHRRTVTSVTPYRVV